jgi:hypothetical protein
MILIKKIGAERVGKMEFEAKTLELVDVVYCLVDSEGVVLDFSI